MPYDYRVLEVKEIPLDDLVVGQGQARKTNVGREVNELADNIRKIGQLHPIVVCESTVSPGKFEILTGQRRYLACKELGKTHIWATVLDRPVDLEEAKVISFSENLIKTDLPKADVIDMCTYLWKMYGDAKVIADKTGLPAHKVREHVKYISLCQELKDAVDSGAVDQSTALRAQKALEASGEMNPKLALHMAKGLQQCIGTQQTKIVDEVSSSAATTPEEIDEVIRAVKKGPTLVDLRIKLFPEQDRALANYAKTEGMKREDAAQSLIMESLLTRGFLEGDEE